ncbi:MAG: CRISPR-associated DxTHG motif protein [Fimbriimonas sp.]
MLSSRDITHGFNFMPCRPILELKASPAKLSSWFTYNELMNTLVGPSL